MKLPGWQLALRFALEIGALVAWGFAARRWAAGAAGLALALAVPIALAALWGTFAVRADPTRSGRAPVPTPGPLRLALELFVLAGAAVLLAHDHHWLACAPFCAGVVVHHLGTLDRLRWLVRQ